MLQKIEENKREYTARIREIIFSITEWKTRKKTPRYTGGLQWIKRKVYGEYSTAPVCMWLLTQFAIHAAAKEMGEHDEQTTEITGESRRRKKSAIQRSDSKQGNKRKRRKI